MAAMNLHDTTRQNSEDSRRIDGQAQLARNVSTLSLLPDSIKADYLFSLAHWSKERDLLNRWERHFIYDMGRLRLRNLPLSDKQQQHTSKIINSATALGFSRPQLVPDAVVDKVDEVGHATDVESMSIKVLDLSARAQNALMNAKIDTVQKLQRHTEDLLALRNLGATTITEIQTKLARLERILPDADGDTPRDIEGLLLRIRSGLAALKRNSNYWSTTRNIKLPETLSNELSELVGIQIGNIDKLINLMKYTTVDHRLRSTSNQAYLVSVLLKLDRWISELNASPNNLDSEISILIRNLDEKQWAIIKKRFGYQYHQTLEEVGREYNVTRERIRQIQAKAQRKLIAATARNTLTYIQLAMKIANELGDDFSFERWKKQLVECNVLIEESSLYDLLTISSATNSFIFPLPENVAETLVDGISPRLKGIRKAVTTIAHKYVRISGAVSVRVLLNDTLAEVESDVVELLSVSGYTRVNGEWWTKLSVRSVPEKDIIKVIINCGPVTPSRFRSATKRHISRFDYPVPPSDVIVKLLEMKGLITKTGGLLYLSENSRKYQSLASTEKIFIELVEEHGPVVTFGMMHDRLLEEGYSGASTISLCSYSPLVVKVKQSLYTMIGYPVDAIDVENAQAMIPRINANGTLRFANTGNAIFETNVGTWVEYGGALSAGPANRFGGSWQASTNGKSFGEITIASNFIYGLYGLFQQLEIEPGDRIRIEFNTSNHTANIEKV